MSFRPPDVRHLPLPVVLEDERFVVVNKPSGLLSVPAKDPSVTDHVRARVLALYPHASGPMSVHRLDMETSGLLVLALDREAHRELSIQFQERRVKKTYRALLERPPSSVEGVVELPLRLDPDRRPYQVVDRTQGRNAKTRYRLLDPDAARVELRPLTGRTHQLRVHCASPEDLASPIRGDRLYGDVDTAPRLMLHARRLVFEHPTTFARIDVEAPEPF